MVKSTFLLAPFSLFSTLQTPRCFNKEIYSVVVGGTLTSPFLGDSNPPCFQAFWVFRVRYTPHNLIHNKVLQIHKYNIILCIVDERDELAGKAFLRAGRLPLGRPPTLQGPSPSTAPSPSKAFFCYFILERLYDVMDSFWRKNIHKSLKPAGWPHRLGDHKYRIRTF